MIQNLVTNEQLNQLNSDLGMLNTFNIGTETLIGKTSDNKNVYRKIVVLKSLSGNNNGKVIDASLKNTTVDYFISAEVYTRFTAGNIIPANGYDNATNRLFWALSDTGVTLTNESGNSISEITATFIYVKK